MTAEQARETAAQLALEVSLGRDPLDDRQETAPKGHTLERLCAEYIELYAKINKRAKSIKDDCSMITSLILPAVGKKKLEQINSHDLQRLHGDLKDRPYLANRVRALLSKMFNLAIEWGWHTYNPALSINKYQEAKRTRWLDHEELKRLWEALESYPCPRVVTVIRLLILTGARKGEVVSATWDQFNLEKGVWTKPAHTTKQKREEHLPLSGQTISLLKEWKEQSSITYLFPGKVEGQSLQDIKKAWATIRTSAGLSGVRLHDLRHTHASHLVSSGLSLSIVGKLLGHTHTSTTQRYAHLADEPLRQAASLFGDKLASFIAEKEN